MPISAVPRSKRSVKAAAASKKTKSQVDRSRKTTTRTPAIVSPAVNPARQPLSSVWQLTKLTTRIVWKNKLLLLGIVVIYGLLNIILAQGLSRSADISTLKSQLSSAFHGSAGSLGSSLTIFVTLIGSAGSTSNSTSGSAYQIILLLVVSLAVIWTLRQVSSGASGIKIRDAYYRGIYPFVPFVLVLIVIAIQLIPLLIGTTVYGAVISNNLAVSPLEKLLWGLFFILFAAITLYFVSSSLFALYIVTLPEMTPLKALRSAKQLVAKRRWSIIRKIVYLPIAIIILGAIIMVPVIVLIAPAAQVVFFAITLLSIVLAHSYMYNLYRDLLRVGDPA